MLQAEKRMLRDEKILLSLNELGYATRKQIQIIEGLGKDRNACRILKRMEEDKIIQSVRREFKVYYLTHRGLEIIGSNKDVRQGQIKHTLMRNDLYIRLGMPDDWKTEAEVSYNGGEKRIVCDARFLKNSEWHFVEVDNQQTMKNNYEKLKKYAALSKDIFKVYNHTPTVIFYTVSQNRKEKLKDYMEKVGVKGRVYV